MKKLTSNTWGRAEQWLSKQSGVQCHLTVLARTCSHTNDGGKCLMEKLQRALESEHHVTEGPTWTGCSMSPFLTGTKSELMTSMPKSEHLCPNSPFLPKLCQCGGTLVLSISLLMLLIKFPQFFLKEVYHLH